LTEMVPDRQIIAYKEERPMSLGPAPLRRLQDLTYHERFGFRDPGRVDRILREWFNLKKPFAYVRQVRKITKQARNLSDEIQNRRTYIEDLKQLRNHKYTHKHARHLRDMRTER